MAETDSPLKRLVNNFILDFAAWLLQRPVREAHPLNVELPTEAIMADQVFHVTLSTGNALLLHIEFQGRRSRPSMHWRMLEYMSRLAYTHRIPMRSVVLYVGRGAGANDTGRHRVDDLDGDSTLVWRYQVIRLWQMPVEELLNLESPALLALAGQTRIEQPDIALPAIVSRLRRVSDAETRGRLLTAFLALIEEEEMVNMVERLLDNDDLLLDTPFLRRIREAGREEGREAGREAGREEGVLVTRRRDIVQALGLRFDLEPSVDEQIVESLESITDETLLETLFTAAIQSENLEAFQAALERAR